MIIENKDEFCPFYPLLLTIRSVMTGRMLVFIFYEK